MYYIRVLTTHSIRSYLKCRCISMNIISIILSNILMYAYLHIYTHSHFFLKNTILSCSLLLLMNILWCAYIRFVEIVHVTDAINFIISLVISYFVSVILVSVFIDDLGFFRTIIEMVFTGILYVITAFVGFIYVMIRGIRND